MSEYLNSASPATIRKPRFVVLANGQQIDGGIKTSITNQNNYSPDRCEISIRIPQPGQPFGSDWWGSQDTIIVEVKFGFLGPNDTETSDKTAWPTIFKGRVDHIEEHPVEFLLELECRDLSATLDVKTSESYSNRTSSEIATILAGKHGLTPDVQATTTLAGVYYKDQHSKITLDSFHHSTTEWHLLIYLAQQEGFDVWVSGDTLHFKPASQPNSTPYLVSAKYLDNGSCVTSVSDLRCSRDLNKSKDIKVTVRSWNSKQMVGHNYSAGGGSSGQSKAKGKGDAGITAQEYVYVLPGLSAAQAQEEANKRYDFLTKLERNISYREPGNLDYDVRSLISVQGLRNSWNGTYYIDTMTRTIVNNGGFEQHITAKNHDTRGDVSVS